MARRKSGLACLFLVFLAICQCAHSGYVSPPMAKQAPPRAKQMAASPHVATDNLVQALTPRIYPKSADKSVNPTGIAATFMGKKDCCQCPPYWAGGKWQPYQGLLEPVGGPASKKRNNKLHRRRLLHEAELEAETGLVERSTAMVQLKNKQGVKVTTKRKFLAAVAKFFGGAAKAAGGLAAAGGAAGLLGAIVGMVLKGLAFLKNLFAPRKEFKRPKPMPERKQAGKVPPQQSAPKPAPATKWTPAATAAQEKEMEKQELAQYVKMSPKDGGWNTQFGDWPADQIMPSSDNNFCCPCLNPWAQAKLRDADVAANGLQIFKPDTYNPVKSAPSPIKGEAPPAPYQPMEMWPTGRTDMAVAPAEEGIIERSTPNSWPPLPKTDSVDPPQVKEDSGAGSD